MTQADSNPKLLEEHYQGLLAGDGRRIRRSCTRTSSRNRRRPGNASGARRRAWNIAHNYPGGPPEDRSSGASAARGTIGSSRRPAAYPDGNEYHIVAVLELRDGRMTAGRPTTSARPIRRPSGVSSRWRVDRLTRALAASRRPRGPDACSPWDGRLGAGDDCE